MSDIDRAVELFSGGCACSQAILGTFGPRFGLDEDRGMRVAAGFAGGMRMAETCGAVTGALMVLGLARCGDNCRTADERQSAYGAVVAFEDDFRRLHGSLVCRELLGCDISTPEGAAAARERGLFRSRCDQFVRAAAGLLEERLRTP
jgi:C_GCAxxG_C_C family probable redox protein